jgi:hypothetical protein
LNLVASGLLQERQLLAGLHTLGDGFHIQTLCQADDSFHNRPILRIGHDVIHK